MFSVLLFLVHTIVVAEAAPKQLNQSIVPALFAFGDSLMDPGNNNLLPTVARSNFPPYGRDFLTSTPTGRFSNGKIATDFIVSELGIKELLPAYLDPDLKPQDLVTGVSFASAGTGFDSLTAKILSVISMEEQLEMFKEYKKKLESIAGVERAAKLISKSAYVVCAGNNDLVDTYYGSLLRSPEYDLPSYVRLLIQTASAFLQDLYSLGTLKLGIVGLPPLGCLPSQRTLRGGANRDCAETVNQAAIMFNSQLQKELKLLSNKLSGATLVYIDLYTPATSIIQNPSLYGFEQANLGCCGTGTIEFAVLCNDKNPYTCRDDSKYVFWDSFHPTQKAYEEIVPGMLRDYIKLLF